MKATELMVGDIVMYKHQHYPTILKVLDNTRCMPFEDMKVSGWVKYGGLDDIEPIPLTPEILEKNGWKKAIGENPVEVWTIRKGVYLHNTDNGYKLREGAEFNVPNIQYVHTLQRVLRCCGLWELAEKFKI